MAEPLVRIISGRPATVIPSVSTPVLEVFEVSKRFGRLTVLDQVSLRIRPGRITALVGPNAAGKSTLIKAILGLIRPDSGRIQVGDAVVNGDPAYRAKIGYMPQSACFPENLTGREVIAMLRDLRSGGPEDPELFDSLGLNGEIGKPLRTLSGGTRQKLNAALAFLFRPSLLILDEPSAGLDPVAGEVLREKIVRCRQNGASVILSSHLLAELDELADDVVFLAGGRVKFEGSVRRLKEMTGQARLERAITWLMIGDRR
jgi:Cu-processing system ATP-binding protein